MTAQIMDKLIFEDQRWMIANADWKALRVAAPSSSDLGFETMMQSTANWSGRIDTFEVRDGMLHLKEMEVNLVPRCQNYQPRPGMSRRDEHIQSWSSVRHSQNEGWSSGHDLRRTRYTFLSFRESPVEYSGEIICGRDFDGRYYVHGGYQTANRFRVRLILDFDGGHIVEDHCRIEFGSSSDRQAEIERSLGAKILARILEATGRKQKPH